jgi:outer membrane lipoprotein carrier protein
MMEIIFVITAIFAVFSQAPEQPALKTKKKTPVAVTVPAQKPADKPAEKPADKPAEKPAVKPTGTATALSADDVVKKLQKYYDDTTDYQAKFSQVYLYKAYGRKQKSSGQVYFKKPGKMRWEYSKPSKKYMISDGSDLWTYEPEEKQAYKLTLEESQLPVVITFLFGKGKLLDEFKAALLSGDVRALDPSDFVVELTPKKTSTDYKKVVMVVSSVDFSLKEVYVYDPVDNENHLSFEKPATNKGVEDSLFKVELPADVKIVSPPSSQPE